MEKTLRAFIAVEVAAEAKEALAQVVARWRQLAPSTVRWVDSQGLHLTLKFLREIPPQQVEGVTTAMRQAAEGVRPFTLDLGDAGAFPNPRRPRVLWVGVTGELEPLGQLYQRLEAGLAGVGFPREGRTFFPHLTLGRVRDPQTVIPLPGEAVSQVRWQVDHLSLIQSTLTPSGALYTRLSEVTLRGHNQGKPALAKVSVLVHHDG